MLRIAILAATLLALLALFGYAGETEGLSNAATIIDGDEESLVLNDGFEGNKQAIESVSQALQDDLDLTSATGVSLDIVDSAIEGTETQEFGALESAIEDASSQAPKENSSENEIGEFNVFNEGGLRFLYPAGWTLSEDPEFSGVRYRIKGSGETLSIGAIIDNGIQDFEKRKENAYLFRAQFSISYPITETEVKGLTFLKEVMPAGVSQVQTVLSTVKNGKCYDIFVTADQTSQDDMELANIVLGSIEID
jgi:hypothetical protein